MIMLRTFLFRIFFEVLLVQLAMVIIVANVFAQFDSEFTYEVVVEVPVIKSNFSQARNKAVKIGLKSALEQNLREFLGDEKFTHNRANIKKMLKKSKKYVKSYRFIEAYDDPIKLMSRVKLEVVLFQDAVNSYLNKTGLVSGLEVEKQIFILINENSMDSKNERQIWDEIPASETSLVRNFIEEGIPVVRRDFIRYAIPEETLLDAVKGDLSAAADIGLKAGADIVIIGNATSILVENNSNQHRDLVRATISIKVVSSQNSSLIAAKSDFATATGNEVLESELKAFNKAGEKLSGFLIPAIQRHWKVVDGRKEFKKPIPAAELDSSPLPWGDL